MIDPDFVATLVQGGRLVDSSPLETLRLLHPLRNRGEINRMPAAVQKIAEDITAEDLVPLIKGLVTAEEEYRWAGGSVSAAIWTFRVLQERCPETAEAVADWVLARTSNPWVPFGTQNFGAKSLREYRNREAAHASLIRVGLEQTKVSEREAEEDRLRRAEQRRRSAQDRTTSARKELLDRLGKLTTPDQARQLASDSEYSVEFYPTALAYAMMGDVFTLLGDETRLNILRKLKGRRRGPWARLKRRLLASFHGFGRRTPWDRSPWF